MCRRPCGLEMWTTTGVVTPMALGGEANVSKECAEVRYSSKGGAITTRMIAAATSPLIISDDSSCVSLVDSPMSHRLIAIGLFAALLPGLHAQTTDPATRELIERLLTRIDGLEKRVAELEKGGTTAVSLATRAAPQQAAQPQAPAPSPTEAMHMAHDQP